MWRKGRAATDAAGGGVDAESYTVRKSHPSQHPATTDVHSSGPVPPSPLCPVAISHPCHSRLMTVIGDVTMISELT